MVWSQYRDAANLIDDAEAQEQPNQIIDSLANLKNTGIEVRFDDWITWYADDLHNVWSSITTYRHDALIASQFMNNLNYDDFCEMCYRTSAKTI